MPDVQIMGAAADYVSILRGTSPAELACAEKVKQYVCGIRRTKENERFEFQVRVGPACFTTETFSWDGRGENAGCDVYHGLYE